MKIKYTLNLREFFNPYFDSVYCKTFENDVISENCYGCFDYKGRKKIGRIYDMEVLKDVLGKEIDIIINDNKVDIDEYKNIMYKLDISYLQLNSRKIKYSDEITFYLSIEIIR